MKASPRLKVKEIEKALKKLPEWTANSKQTSISTTRTFKNHIDALVYIARITVNAQVANHHPEIVFTYSKVKVTLTSHEEKGLTKKDIDLALKISNLQ